MSYHLDPSLACIYPYLEDMSSNISKVLFPLSHFGFLSIHEALSLMVFQSLKDSLSLEASGLHPPFHPPGLWVPVSLRLSVFSSINTWFLLRKSHSNRTIHRNTLIIRIRRKSNHYKIFYHTQGKRKWKEHLLGTYCVRHVKTIRRNPEYPKYSHQPKEVVVIVCL